MLKCIAILVFAFNFLFDLDIILPPGDPVENMSFLYPPVPIETRRSPQEPEGPKHRGTGVLKKVFPVAPPVVTINITSFSPVPTVDFPIEVTWVTEAKMSRDKIADELDYESIISKRARFEAYIRTLTKIALRYCHFNRTGDAEYKLYFTLMGAPAGLNAVMVPDGTFKEMEEFCNNTRAYIDPETEVPEFPEAGDSFDGMVTKLALLELVSYHPFTDSPYAPELDNFAREEIYPYIKKLLESDNKRVRRNAVYYLGLIRTRKSLGELFDILKTTKDNVEKVRALFFLTQNGYPGLVEYLLERLDKEEDEVFRIMIINSLGNIGDNRAFEKLVALLDKSGLDDWELCSSLLKAATKCMPHDSPDDYELLKEAVRKVYMAVTKDGSDVFNDPDYSLSIIGRPMPPSYVLSYVGNARRLLVKDLSLIALSAAGHKNSYADIMKRLTAINFNSFKDIQYSPSGGGALSSFQSGARTFFVRALPQIKSDYAEKFLKNLILTGYEHDNVIFSAIDAYFNNYREEFDGLVIALLRSKARGRIVDRALRYIHVIGSYSEKLEKELYRQVKSYGPNSPDNEKYLATLSVFYLGSLGKLDDKILIKLIKYELALLAREDAEEELKEQPIWSAILKSRSYLHRVAIQMLGKTRTKKAKEFLLKLTGHKDAAIRRLAVKALGEFSSDDVKEKLFDKLLDNDGWTRVISYLSLRRITGKSMSFDWYFSKLPDIKKAVSEYQDITG